MGLLAFDIDGTVTDSNIISLDFLKYCQKLFNSGWKIAFVTGRTFSGAKKILNNVNFPYYLAVQNGSMIVRMADKKILSSYCLDKDIFKSILDISNSMKFSCMLCSGDLYGEKCYYDNKSCDKDFFVERAKKIGESCLGIDNFDDIHEVSAMKFFDTKERLDVLLGALQPMNITAPLIKDPFTEGRYVIQVTNFLANKGNALKFLRDLLNVDKVIAAGNDINDIPLLIEADISIAVGSDNPKLKDKADISLPLFSVDNIINGIEKAIKLL